MADTVFVRGQGGSIFQRDIPAEGSLQREMFDEAIAKGDLMIVASAEWVERGDGSKYLVEGEGPKPTDNSRPVKANFTGKQPQTTSEV